MKFIANSFSLQMTAVNSGIMQWNEISKEKFDSLSQDAISYIGHEDLANILGVEYRRESLKLRQGDVLLVAQVTGGRLPEGAPELPENIVIRYFCVQIVETGNKLLENEVD